MPLSAERTAVTAVVEPLEFDELYELHFESIYRIVARLSGGINVDDLVQEVLVVVARRLPEFDYRAKVTTWMFQICLRVVLADRRRRRVRSAIAAVFGKQIGMTAPPQQLLSIERAEEAQLVARAVDSLGERKRVVMLLHVVEGWPCEKIAECLGVPVGTVHTRLFHARRDLAKTIERLRKRQRGERQR